LTIYTDVNKLVIVRNKEVNRMEITYAVCDAYKKEFTHHAKTQNDHQFKAVCKAHFTVDQGAEEAAKVNWDFVHGYFRKVSRLGNLNK